jgi:predicted RNA-binding protein (TIGR00451 family)
MLFRKALKKSGKSVFSQLSELIITSPLSVVPRELENIFPARFYDIPVAGIWSNEEIEITASLLSKVLKSYPDDTVIINHTHGKGYEEILEIVKSYSNFEVFNTSSKSVPTSNDSLSKLTSTTSGILAEKMWNEKIGLSPKLNELQTIADYQYGIGVGKELFHKIVKIRGKYPRNKQIFLDGELNATLRSSTGFLMLTPSAAQRIVKLSFNNLEFADENLKGSTIYAPGLIEADIRILPNDEIFIVKEGKLLATATALVSGKDMNKMSSATSIKQIREKSLPSREHSRKVIHWDEEHYLRSGLGKALVFILPTKGCSWALSKSGGCSICGYIYDNPQEPDFDMIIDSVKDILSKKLGEEEKFSVKLFTSGSFLDKRELPLSVQASILKEISSYKRVEEVVLESRPEYVTQETLNNLADVLEKDKIEIAIGLESSNNEILKKSINKGFFWEDYEKAVERVLEFGAKIKTYLLFKPPFVSEYDSMVDILQSVSDISKIGG